MSSDLSSETLVKEEASAKEDFTTGKAKVPQPAGRRRASHVCQKRRNMAFSGNQTATQSLGLHRAASVTKSAGGLQNDRRRHSHGRTGGEGAMTSDFDAVGLWPGSN